MPLDFPSRPWYDNACIDLRHKPVHQHIVAQASAHDEQMEDLVRAEILVFGVEERQLQGVDDAAHGVDDAARQEPGKAGSGQGADDLGERQEAYPAHGDVNQGREPLGAGDPAGVDDDTHDGDSPDQTQQDPAGLVAQHNHAHRSVGAGDENEDHHVVQFAQKLVDFRGNIQAVIDRAGGVKADHTQDKDCERDKMQVVRFPGRFQQQGSGGADG